VVFSDYEIMVRITETISCDLQPNFVFARWEVEMEGMLKVSINAPVDEVKTFIEMAGINDEWWNHLKRMTGIRRVKRFHDIASYQNTRENQCRGRPPKTSDIPSEKSRRDYLRRLEKVMFDLFVASCFIVMGVVKYTSKHRYFEWMEDPGLFLFLFRKNDNQFKGKK